jgi:hypothetical protein
MTHCARPAPVALSVVILLGAGQVELSRGFLVPEQRTTRRLRFDCSMTTTTERTYMRLVTTALQIAL